MIKLRYIIENQCTTNRLVIHTVKIKSRKRLRKIIKMIGSLYNFEHFFLLNEIVISNQHGWYILRKNLDDSHLKYYINIGSDIRAKKVKKKKVFEKIYIFSGLSQNVNSIYLNNQIKTGLCSNDNHTLLTSQQQNLFKLPIDELPPNSRLGPRIKEWNDWEDYNV